MNISRPTARLTIAVSSFVILGIVGWAAPAYATNLLVDCLVFSILALGLNLLLGYTGLPSFGHAAYFAVGAYTAGLSALYITDDFWLCAAVAIAMSVIVGAIYGLLALRTNGIFFLIITLALGQIAWAIFYSWRGLTGGADGLNIPMPHMGLGEFMSTDNGYFFLVLVATVAVLLLMLLIVRSPFGEALSGIKQNPVRMESLGYNVWLYKFLAFVISAGISGFAGVLFAFHNGFVSPETAAVTISAEALLMVIIGGAGTLVGPVLGAFVVVYIGDILSSATDHWMMMFGMLYVAVMLFAPKGAWTAIRGLFTIGRSS